MNHVRSRVLAVLAAAVLGGSAASVSASEFVRMEFNLGLNQPDGSIFNTVYLELFDDTPLTQANFLNYVNDGDYDGVVMHRSIPGFVLQGGGFTWNGTTFDHIPTDGTVDNEFGRTNARGTIAMAKVGGNPDSATSEFFFNYTNNAGTPPNGLDFQNGGFTVFARVLGNGMDLIDAFETLQTFNVGQLSNVPLLNGNQFLVMNSVTQHTLVAGDTNFDGLINQDDVDLLTSVLVGGSDEPQYDVDGNGTVEQADLDLLNSLLLPGDLDGDGFVGLADLDIILNNWNQAIPPGDPLADPTGDDFVGLADLDIVLNNWNSGTPPPSSSAVVPEPAAATLIGLGAGLLMLRRKA